MLLFLRALQRGSAAGVARPQGAGILQPERAASVPAPCRGRVKGAILFRKREWPLWNPKRKAFDWQFRARMTFVLPEWECLRAALPRWVLLYDLMCSYHPLPLCPSYRSTA